jgi:hypothetical protein
MAEHQDAFFTWRRWLGCGALVQPFEVVHIDAHADLGLGEGGWVYLLSELLALPLEKRTDPRVGAGALNSANYLAFAIANRWIRKLTYVFPYRKPRKRRQVLMNIYEGDKFVRTIPAYPAMNEEQGPRPGDLMPLVFRNSDTRTNVIELRCFTPPDVKTLAYAKVPPTPVYVEPAVPFEYIRSDQFRFTGFTHMTVAQSPQYTPASADKLLPIFRDYFTEA